MWGSVRVRAVPGLPRYWVSRDGRVFTSERRWPYRLRERKASVDADGYRRMTAEGAATPCGRCTLYVHRLVALAWVGPVPFDGAEVRHKNGDPADNRARNLVWGTHQENMDDRARHGRNPLGARNGRWRERVGMP